MVKPKDIKDAWEKILPEFKRKIEDYLIAKDVTIKQQPVFDEWHGGDPTLAVYWSVPSRLSPPDQIGRSISFHLEFEEKEPVPPSITLVMWGQIWTDDFTNRKRSFQKAHYAEVPVDLTQVLTDIAGFLRTVDGALSTLINEVARATIDSSKVQPADIQPLVPPVWLR